MRNRALISIKDLPTHPPPKDVTDIKVTSIITVTKDEATKQNTFYENQTGKGLVVYLSAISNSSDNLYV